MLIVLMIVFPPWGECWYPLMVSKSVEVMCTLTQGYKHEIGLSMVVLSVLVSASRDRKAFNVEQGTFRKAATSSSHVGVS